MTTELDERIANLKAKVKRGPRPRGLQADGKTMLQVQTDLEMLRRQLIELVDIVESLASVSTAPTS